MKQHRFLSLTTVAVIIFLYLPIIILVITSFNESRFGGAWTGFSLKWYKQLLQEKALWKALKNSLIVGLNATVVSTVLGTLAALSLYRYKGLLQKTHNGLIYTLLIIPDILMGVSLLLFFVSVQWQLGLFTVFIAHTTFCLSYVTMVVLARLKNFDYTILEAARDLGANTWTVFRKITFPLLSPAIIAGALLAFTLSIDDFVITFFVIGPGSTTLPVYVYSMIKFGSPSLINALSCILLLVTGFIAWITQYLTEKM